MKYFAFVTSILKNYLNPNKLHFLWPIYLFFSCIFLQTAVHCIPVQPISEHISKSLSTFRNEGEYTRSYGVNQDNYTDAILLLMAQTPADELTPFQRVFYSKNEALASPPYERHLSSYRTLMTKNGYNTVATYYPRYWHGFQVVIKPLLYFFTYETLRQLNCAFQLLCVVFIILMMHKQKLTPLIAAYVLWYLLLRPASIWNNFTYSIMFYVTSATLIILLKQNNWLRKNIGFFNFFVMVGMCTSWLDFLTYPSTSLIIPLTFILFAEENNDIKKNIEKIFWLSLAWGIGYVGMWAMKWILSTLIMDQNIFVNVFDKLKERSSAHVWNNDFSRFTALKVNYDSVMKHPFFKIPIISLFCLYIGADLLIYKRIIASYKLYLKRLVPFLLLALGAPVWYLICANHSIEHSPFVFRTYSCTIFALMAGIAYAWKLPYKIKHKS